MKLKTIKIINDKTYFLAVSFIENKPINNIRLFGFMKVIPNALKEEYSKEVSFTKSNLYDYIKTIINETFSVKKSFQTITLTNQIKYNKPSLLKFDVNLNLDDELILGDCLSKLNIIKDYIFNEVIIEPHFRINEKSPL